MMNPQRTTLLGALVLCGLAFAAASASATGLTALECKEVAKETGNYKTSACTTPKVEKSNFETVVIPAKEPKEVEGTDTRNKTAAEGGGHGLGSTAQPVVVFHFTINGAETTLTCGIGNATGGKIENKEEASGEMVIHATGASVTWSECHAAPKNFPDKSCKVQSTAPLEPENAIKTNALTGTTEANHKVVIKPERTKKEEGEGKTPPFTEFKILKSSTPECFTGGDIPVQVTGEAWSRVDTTTHSHLTFDEASNEGSPLRFNKVATTQTETVTGFTKGNKEATVGAETF